MARNSNLGEVLLGVAAKMAECAPQRVRLAHNEDDRTTAKQPEAAHFLKVDGKRVGRDIEMYGFMSQPTLMGDGGALVQFVEEIVLPMKALVPETYATAAESMKLLGREIFPDKADEWDALFDDFPAAPKP